MKQKLGPNQKKWLTALESGEYEQTVGALCDGNGFCCLGVACEVLGLEAEWDELYSRYTYEDTGSVAPQSVMHAMRLKDECGDIDVSTSLTAMNDGGFTFRQIASFIRANPEKVFKEPA